ncbi:MAG TPA: UvrD-helicase domain-containing protein [Bacteroidia bacterium]|nr:UvrD-helicase domain-containing protein [Bacteroidia bacterium]
MNFTVYKSSAGSGKTFTLVKEYLRLALDDTADPPQRYREILAITFTNKAAAEMKERIIRALKEIADPAGGASAMGDILAVELKLDLRILASRARHVLEAILHNYTDFAIGTIDSFTHRIVRAFAHDLHLPVNFEVELDSDKIIRQAVDILLTRIGEDPELTKVLVAFSQSRADEEKHWSVEHDLRDIAEQLLKEEGAAYAEKLRALQPGDFLAIHSKLSKTTKIFEEKVKAIAPAVVKRAETAGLTIDDFASTGSGIMGRFTAYSNGKLDKFGDYNSKADSSYLSGKYHSGKADAAAKAEINAMQPFLTESWSKLEELRENEYGEYALRGILMQKIYATAVLNELEKIIFNFRTEDNILHISEFNRLIAKVVFEEPVPFIYERLGEKYRNYLIDEFQDTSAVQWQNLLPLIDNALAGGNFNMLVGDGKQAIYRWRGGEVEQFTGLSSTPAPHPNPLVRERLASLARNYRDKNLATNRRSKKEVVLFNNDFFHHLAARLPDGQKRIYHELKQEFLDGNDGGYVRIEALDLHNGPLSPEEIFITKTVECIQQLKTEGWKYQDIAVLTRTNKEGSLLSAALLDAGIQVLSPESLLLRQSPSVNFIVAILRCIDQPSDELAGAQALEYLSAIGKLQAPLHDRLVEFRDAGKRIGNVIRAANIPFDEEHLARLPLYQRCEEIILLFGLSERFDAYLLFFLDEALKYSNDRAAEKTGFAEWWEDRSKNASVVAPEGMNAVHVMTIHKSKGLEFPVVILPFANWKFKMQKKEFWIEVDDPEVPELQTAFISANLSLLKTPKASLYEEEEDKSRLDMLNVLYVGMTRAVQQLYVYTSHVPEEVDDPRNLDSIFNYALNRMNAPFVNGVFEAGNKTPGKFPNGKAILTIQPSSIKSGRWEGRLKLRSHAAENWDISDPTGKKDRGILLHTLFAEVESPADLGPALEILLQKGLATPEQIGEFRMRAEKMMQLPELALCFAAGAKIRRESEILLPEGTVLRPDRVVELDGKTIIVDYKTGAQDQKHKHQLNRYAEALREMGYQSVERKLVYTEEMLVESW